MTVSKIQILGGPKEYVPVLQAFIGIENLPSNYGGTLLPLDSDIHPYTEIMLNLLPLTPSATSTTSTTSREEAEENHHHHHHHHQHASCGLDGNKIENNDDNRMIVSSITHNYSKYAEAVDMTTNNLIQLDLYPSQKDFQNYPYPENTPGSDSKTNEKYWNNLSEQNESKLHIIQDWLLNDIDKKDHDLLVLHSLHPPLVYLRYLRANQFDINKTKTQITNSIEWRKKMNIDILVTRLTIIYTVLYK